MLAAMTITDTEFAYKKKTPGENVARRLAGVNVKSVVTVKGDGAIGVPG